MILQKSAFVFHVKKVSHTGLEQGESHFWVIYLFKDYSQQVYSSLYINK